MMNRDEYEKAVANWKPRADGYYYTSDLPYPPPPLPYDCEIHKQKYEEYWGCMKCLREEMIEGYNSEIQSVLMQIIDLSVHRPLFRDGIDKEWYGKEFNEAIKKAVELTRYETEDTI
jgi:hypothetical protein